MLHFVTSYMNQNKSRKQTLESAQYGLEISFKGHTVVVYQVAFKNFKASYWPLILCTKYKIEFDSEYKLRNSVLWKYQEKL